MTGGIYPATPLHIFDTWALPLADPRVADWGEFSGEQGPRPALYANMGGHPGNGP
jgi:hypothetical protein